MNNDLISRSELKKVIKEIFDTVDVLLFDDIIATIDNAPTIEAYPFEQVQELVKFNQQSAQEIENLKRLQGEWINDSGLYKCSKCQTLHTEFWASVVPLERMYAFCPYCGADMRQEVADETDN